MAPDQPLTDAALAERKRWRLESEITAIDRYAGSLGTPLGGAGSSGLTAIDSMPTAC